jgi:uncharacterized protein (DUF1501 family)
MTKSLCPDTGLRGFQLTRRSALLGLTAAFTLGRTSMALAAPETDQRFVVILMRGALDGLSAVQPYGDPSFADIRGNLALPQPGQDGGVFDLGGKFGLHPSLPQVHAMYAANEALIVHAVAGHYRSRSHFEAQDCLESGSDQRLNSGWLNRAVGLMPTSGRELALSLGLSAPLLLRGPTMVEAWAPDHFAQPDTDLYQRLLAISRHDPVVGPAIEEGLKQRGFAANALSGQAADPKHDKGFEVLAGSAGRLLAQPNGPRVAVLEIGGWDTHNAQKARLQNVLGQLDNGIAALKAGLGDAWGRTVVLAVTEFGRTARINGTGGTDHGTAGMALLAGGAVAGGKVVADWPGLRDGQLFENRDLAPTADLRSVIKGVLIAHMKMSPGAMERVLPGSLDASPMSGLVRV